MQFFVIKSLKKGSTIIHRREILSKENSPKVASILRNENSPKSNNLGNFAEGERSSMG